MTIIGIDPGKSGGVAVIKLMESPIGSAFPMPLTKDKAIDLHQLEAIITNASPHKVYIEDTQYRHGNGAKQDKTRYTEHGMILGLLEAMRVPYELVKPQVWQKDILGDFEKGKSKTAAWNHVRVRWESVIDFTPGKKTVPHDGMVDAMCIAEWGWWQNA